LYKKALKCVTGKHEQYADHIFLFYIAESWR
jgi:hypothetical protein